MWRSPSGKFFSWEVQQHICGVPHDTLEPYLIKVCINKNVITHSGFLRTERKKTGKFLHFKYKEKAFFIQISPTTPDESYSGR